MNGKKVWVAAAVLAMLAAAWLSYRWTGVVLVLSAAVMWILLHFTRTMQVLKRATNRPIGHVASAVMLNAKLSKGDSLLHAIALTKSLGLQQSPKDQQPEIFRWADTGGSHVTCEFRGGKLHSWSLYRPPQEGADALPLPPASAPLTDHTAS